MSAQIETNRLARQNSAKGKCNLIMADMAAEQKKTLPKKKRLCDKQNTSTNYWPLHAVLIANARWLRIVKQSNRIPFADKCTC